MIKRALTRIWYALFPRSLKSVTGACRTVSVHGVRLRIRKLNPLDFAIGANVLQASFDTYEGVREAKAKPDMEFTEANVKKIKDHYRDVFMQAVQWPLLCRKPEDAHDDVIPVDNLMTDWDFAQDLYSEIMLYTYGKKKLASPLSVAKGA